MEIKFVSRQSIIDNYLEKVFDGYELTESDVEFISDMSNGS